MPVSATCRARSVSTWTRSVSGTCVPGERDLGDVQHRIEDRAAPGDGLTGVDDEHARLGDDRELLGAVAVEHVMRRSVEHPAVGVAVRGHSAVHGRAGLSAGRTGRRPAGRTGSASPGTGSDRWRGPALRARSPVRPRSPGRSARSSPHRRRSSTAASGRHRSRRRRGPGTPGTAWSPRPARSPAIAADRRRTPVTRGLPGTSSVGTRITFSLDAVTVLWIRLPRFANRAPSD